MKTCIEILPQHNLRNIYTRSEHGQMAQTFSCNIEWENGDIISDVRLNKLEEAIYDLSVRTGEMSFINEQIDKNTNDISTILDIIDEPPIYSKPTISAALSKNTVEHNINSSITISSSCPIIAGLSSRPSMGRTPVASKSSSGIKLANIPPTKIFREKPNKPSL